jgi:hypothetical protein
MVGNLQLPADDPSNNIFFGTGAGGNRSGSGNVFIGKRAVALIPPANGQLRAALDLKQLAVLHLPYRFFRKLQPEINVPTRDGNT